MKYFIAIMLSCTACLYSMDGLRELYSPQYPSTDDDNREQYKTEIKNEHEEEKKKKEGIDVLAWKTFSKPFQKKPDPLVKILLDMLQENNKKRESLDSEYEQWKRLIQGKEHHKIRNTSFIEAFLKNGITINCDNGSVMFPSVRRKDYMYQKSWNWAHQKMKSQAQLVCNTNDPVLYANKKVITFLNFPEKYTVKFLEHDNADMWYMVSRIRLYKFLFDTILYVGATGGKHLTENRIIQEEALLKEPYPKALRNMLHDSTTAQEGQIKRKFIRAMHTVLANRLSWHGMFMQSKVPNKLPEEYTIYMPGSGTNVLKQRSIHAIRKILVREALLSDRAKLRANVRVENIS